MTPDVIESPNRHQRQSVGLTVWWWFVTLVTLVVLDDLTFGPFFWAVARLMGAVWAVAAVYAIYIPAQMFLVVRGTADSPGPVADWFLRRLDLQRRYSEVAQREGLLRSKIVGGLSSVAFSLLIGGVIPPLILWRQGYPRTFVIRIALLTSTVYATEFAVLHGLIPAWV